jgi:hypothetical protein
MILGGIVLIVISIASLYFGTKEEWRDFLWFIIACIIGGVMLCNEGVKAKHPTALDVYRGKTTLEITYRDSMPVDSVVVYKVR